MAHPSIESLPMEILHQILSHFDRCPSPPLIIDENGDDCVSAVDHPFYNIAAVSRQLRNAVESYCRHLLLSKKSITKFKEPTSAPAKKKLVYRQKWYKWATTRCWFCGKASSRTAIMDNELLCCRACDKTQWPGKITMTEAIKKYNLSKLDIILPNPIFPSPKLLPPLRFGQYDCMGVLTTMFLESEVKERTKFVYRESSSPSIKHFEYARRIRIMREARIDCVNGRWWHVDEGGVRRYCRAERCVECRESEIIARFRDAENARLEARIKGGSSMALQSKQK